jgi:zinc protease
MSCVRVLAVLPLLWAGLVQAIPEIQHWRTDNGARVYFVAAPQLPMVDVRVVFDAGSARDDGKPGLASLTNDMLSQGAGKLDADAIAERFDAVGARFGSQSHRDMAVVSLRSLTREELLNPALDTLALVLAEPSFPESALKRERGRMLVGLEQQAQSPGDIAQKALYKAVFRDRPYASPVLGTRESVAKLGADDVRAFHRRYYVARNAVVAIVGDLDRAGAERLAERVVARLPRGEPAAHLAPVPPLREAKRIDIDYPSAQTHILLGQPGMQRGDPDYFPLYVGNYVLGGGGLVSRLSEEVREKRGLSYSVYSYFIPMHVTGPFIVGLQTRNESAGRALRVLDATLKQFVAEGPTGDELAAAKKHITGGFPLQIDSNSDIVGYLAVIGFYGLPLDYLKEFTRRVDSVSAHEVKDAFQRRVHPERMVTVMVGGGA